ncbi:unnamed protein product [Pleuronectes platessa]|uniref:Uncharacterized protein n=1 Tax=Pleuronectes platessa TaxID=8262 RepID=A0A9N7UFT7_PLEPL|nr:unnamed protein product [Pleuronectes platessa]
MRPSVHPSPPPFTFDSAVLAQGGVGARGLFGKTTTKALNVYSSVRTFDLMENGVRTFSGGCLSRMNMNNTVVDGAFRVDGGVRQGEAGVRLPGATVVDELVLCKAQGDGVCEVRSIAVINNPDRSASALEPCSHT